MSPGAGPGSGEVASLLLTHARLERDGYALRTVRFDTRPRSAGRIIVGLVWRRWPDRVAEVRHSTLSRADAQALLQGLGGLAAL